MRSTALVVLALCIGCGGSTSSPDPTPTAGGSPSGGTPSSSGGGSGSSGGGTNNGGNGATPGGDAGPVVPPGPPAGGSSTYGTYIVLGDSISDRGGEAPFFYDLFYKNDDTLYPQFKGKDLSTKYPGIQYVHAAVAGSVTDLYPDEKAGQVPTMAAQIQGLGSSYPGDVLITITIGGNDLNFHSYDAISGNDADDRKALAQHLHDELAELTKPGRLGSGKVTILEANIYDASDGQGNWLSGGHCGPNVDVGKDLDTQGFAAWNAVIASAIAEVSSADHALDLHALFAGHGFNGSDRWYYQDCIHPNQKGHGMLRAAFWQMLTGEVI